MLADDHEPVLAELRITLSEEVDIVGAVRNGQDVIAEVERLDPDALVAAVPLRSFLPTCRRRRPG